MFFTSKEEREKAVPYSGFNTFTPGVSWGKVFAKQRESAGVGGGGKEIMIMTLKRKLL